MGSNFLNYWRQKNTESLGGPGRCVSFRDRNLECNHTYQTVLF